MPAIPFPFLTFCALLFLLVALFLSGKQPCRPACKFIAACTLMALLCALRWQLHLDILQRLQAISATLLPPFAWRCFNTLTANRASKNATLLLPPAAVIVALLLWPQLTDLLLCMLYMGYGISLIACASRGSDRFIFARLDEAAVAMKLAIIAGLFLCFSGLTDVFVAVNFYVARGDHAPQLIALAQAILLPLIALATIFAARTAPEKHADAPAPVNHPVPAESETLCAMVEKRIRENELYLNADLTLSLLARKVGVPARHISRAVNGARGCNVSQWLNSFRIKKAQNLLLTTQLPVTDIMLATGFITKSNFNREFTRLSGMSPTMFRKQAAESPAPCSESD